MMVHSEFFLKALTTVSLLYSTYKISYYTTRAFSAAMNFIWLPVIKIEALDNEDSDDEDSDLDNGKYIFSNKWQVSRLWLVGLW